MTIGRRYFAWDCIRRNWRILISPNYVEHHDPDDRSAAIATILIVDDELDMRMLVRFVFELANDGLQIVAEAGDGMEAVDVWRGLEGPPEPDVVILDNRMPRLSGVQAAEKILAERPDQIVVLYSAFLDDEVASEAARIGIKAVVPKTELSSLPDVVRDLVRSA